MAYDFPNAPTLGQAYAGWVYDGEKWVSQGVTQNAVRYDLPQGLTANQMAQGRSNISVLKKNYIINGAMMISQENGTTAGVSGNYYPVDMFYMGGSNAGVQTVQQVASLTPGGSPNRFRLTCSTADASVGAGDYGFILTAVEGLRTADLKSGTASAKTVTLQFGIKAPAGTYCVALKNAAQNRAYIAEYVIASGETNTDVVKSVTIALDTIGTWATDNTVGMYIYWAYMAGSSSVGPANTWQTAGIATANQFNLMGTVNNVFELFDVSLTEGTVAPPFQVPDYASELAACKRYFNKVGVSIQFRSIAAGVAGTTTVSFPDMRAIPTAVTTTIGSQSNIASRNYNGVTINSLGYQIVGSAGAAAPGTDTYELGSTITLNARL